MADKMEIMLSGVDGGDDLMLVIKPNPDDPNLIVTVGRIFVNRRKENKANAERLVLCWNEHDKLIQENADYKEGCEGLKLSIQDFRQQRDNLLAACDVAEITLRDIASRHISSSFHNNRIHSDAYTAIDILKAAIAKSKE